jgi:hypothetical protein
LIATVGTSGFFGKKYVGISYELDSIHQFESVLGHYSKSSNPGFQINLSYRYSIWNIPWKNKIWKPATLGVNAMYALDQKNYFVESPDKYPSDDYYEQTGLRGAVEFGSSMIFLHSNLELIYYLRFLDNGLVAFYNNNRRDLQYYTSSGIGLSYHF